MLWGRDCRGASFAPDDPASLVQRLIFLRLMTAKTMMARRTTATTMGTTMATTGTVLAEMIKESKLILNQLLIFFCQMEELIKMNELIIASNGPVKREKRPLQSLV